MPPVIRFPDGIITYTLDERLFGVFRFPRKSDGSFCSPVSVKDSILNLSKDQIKEILSMQNPVVFDAYKIPQHGFEFFSMDDTTFSDISVRSNDKCSTGTKNRYETEINSRIDSVKKKIISSPNFLLILDQILSLKQKDIKKISSETNGIIHI